MVRGFDWRGVLLLVPFGLYLVGTYWLADDAFGAWPFTLHLAIATVLLLPWLKARVYCGKSMKTIIGIQVSALVGIAILEFLFRGAGSLAADYITILIAAIALVWFAVHERRKNRLAAKARE